MAIVAGLAKAALVLVVKAVTVVTLFRRLIRLATGLMAGFTATLLVTADEQKAGAFTVVKPCLVPAFAVMALLTPVTIGLEMHILDTVTTDAFVWRILVLLVDMAGGTHCGFMCAFQWKVGIPVVVEG